MYLLCNEVTDTQFWLGFGGKFELIVTPKCPCMLLKLAIMLKKVMWSKFKLKQTMFIDKNWQ